MLQVKENNFNIIRLIAALFVMIGHMGNILGTRVPSLAGKPLHTIGVNTLFLLGGYLITKSWERDPHLGRYLIRRFFRFYPPYAVMILIMVWITGPLLSSLGMKGYFSSWYLSYLWNLRFYIVFAQPGVFEYNPIPNVVNGSLWTMPVEAAFYLMLPIVLILLCWRRTKKIALIGRFIFTGVVCGLDIFVKNMNSEQSLVLYATDWISALHLAVFFFIGSLFACPCLESRCNLQVSILCLSLLLCLQMGGMVVNELSHMILYPYFIFSLALTPAPVFAVVGRRFELSYGIYLYGFFFQQLVVKWRMDYQLEWGFLTCFLLSLAFTAFAAFLSSWLVEKPFISLSHKILRWMKRIPGSQNSMETML